MENIMYQLLPNNPIRSQSSQCVIRTLDGAFVPFDPANTDYQAYLKWVAEGNTPLPAEENT